MTIEPGWMPILIAAAAAVLTLFVGLGARRLQPYLTARAGERIALYLTTAIRTVAVAAALVVIAWCLGLQSERTDFGETLTALGLHFNFAPDEGAVLAVAMVAAGAAVSGIIGILRMAMGGAPTQAALDFLPRTPAETCVFSLVLAPVGSVGEEIIFRGFLMGQLWGLTGDGWIAAILSSILFGLMHGYQGAWGMARTGLIGLALAAGVILTGSLIPSIIAHFFANLLGASFRASPGGQREVAGHPPS